MTEPIAVDVPAKPAFPRSVPLPLPAPGPRVDSPPKAEPAKPATGVTPAPAAKPDAAALTPAPAAPPKTMRGLLAKLTRKQLTIGASAVFSLVAGIGVVRLMFPAKDEARPPAGWAAEQTVAARSNSTPAPASVPAAPPKSPSVEVVPASGDVIVPVAPPMSPYPTRTEAPATAKPTSVTPVPVAPPTVVPEAPKYPPMPFAPAAPAYPVVPAAPAYGESARHAPPSYGDPAKPSDVVPPPASLDYPPIPSPTVYPAGANEPPKTPLPPLPAVPPVTPPGGMAPAVPPPMDLGPVIPTTPVTPKAPDLPPVPVGSVPVTPAPVLPPIPGSPMAPAAPGAFPPPADVTPKPDGRPPMPGYDPRAGVGTPAAYTKPGGSTDARPLAPEAAPKTDFDVDLYDPKANDTYDSISQEYYNDKRYAAALRAFNQNQPLQGGRYVNVPPIHILKKRFPGQVGGVVAPAGNFGAPSPAPSAAPQWGPAGDRVEAVPTRTVGAGRGVFVVPQGGMTMKAVSRLTLGTEQRWGEVYGMNPNLRPDEVLPAGTELKLPSDARIP